MRIESARGLPLFITIDARPLVTVENYYKWYDLWLVLAFENEVLPISFSNLEPTAALLGESANCDHTPNPGVVVAYAVKRGWHVDPEAMKEMLERWRGR
jgi:hypothetical protein